MVTHLHVAFEVEDYDAWKKGYDASRDVRKASGEVSYRIYHNVDDPGTVTVLSVQKSAENVQNLMDSPDMKQRMQAAGITKMGQMFLLEEVESGTL